MFKTNTFNSLSKVIKKTPVIVSITVLVMLIIPLMAYLTLRSASVQTYLANKAAAYLSAQLGAKVSVGGVNISAMLNIVLEDVAVQDKKDSLMIYSKEIGFNVRKISFSNQSVELNKVFFEDATIQIIRYPDEEQYNYQFFIDYFAKNRDDSLTIPKWDMGVKSFQFKNAAVSLKDYNAQTIEKGFDPGNFSITELNTDVRNIALTNGVIEAQIYSFSLQEDSGFEISSLSADIVSGAGGSHIDNLRLQSGGSMISLDVGLRHDTYSAFSNFIEEVGFEIDFNPSRVTLGELGHFVPALHGIDGKVTIKGIVSGKFNNLRGKNISLQYGAISQFDGHFNLVGLPVIEETFINFSVENLITTSADVEILKLPGNSNGGYVSLPPELDKFGVTSFTGNFTGFVNDFVAFGKFTTALGSIQSNLAFISNGNDVTYTGRLATNGFRLDQLLDEPDLGEISLSTHVTGKGYNLSNLDVRITGEIGSLEYRDYNYKQLKIAGNFSNKMFNGNFMVDDPNIKFDFGGVVNFREDTPLMNFTAQIQDANLTRLNIFQRDSLYQSIVSATVHVDGKGNNFNNIEGEVNIYSTEYYEKSITPGADSVQYNQIFTDVIALENKIRGNNNHELHFYSDFLDIQLNGELHYNNLVKSVNRFFYTYAPARYKNIPVWEGDSETEQNAEYQIHVKNTLGITSLFLPSLQIAPHSYFYGHINTRNNEFSFQGNSKYIHINENILRNPQVSILADSHQMEIVARGDKLYLTDSLYMENFFTSGIITSDTITMLTQWENYNSRLRNLGSIKTRGTFLSPSRTEFTILPSYAYINDSLWSVSPNNNIIIDTTSVSVHNFHLFKNREYLKINGLLSDNPHDELDIVLNNFDIESLDFLLGKRRVDFSGIASGELRLSNLRGSPNISAELMVKTFAFNNDELGDLYLKSQWDSQKRGFKVTTEIIYHGNVGSNKPVIANGYFYPQREKDNLDIDITIENFKVSVFGRYVEEFASNFRGLASGKLRLEGPIYAPELSGRARLVRTGFKVDYLNTTYSFAHEVEVGKDYLKIDNLILNDTLGNSANVSGIIRHKNFHGFSVDITMNPERMIVLNTRPHHNELFYGSAFATGRVHVHGRINDIKIDVAATSNRGTQIFLPLDYYGEITESSFISFVSPGKENTQVVNFKMPANLGISLNFDLSLTPDAEVQIIFDSKIGDIMRGRGFGDIKMEMDRQGFFFMYGDYTVQEGDYLFTLQNLINKRFRMMQGGTIRWTGDPYDADIDIRALYRLRTSLFDLAAMQSDTSDVYRRRVPVETVLHLRNKLFNPSVNFEIQLPGSDETTREMIQRLISTEQEMNRQVFSLLILNRFVPPEDGFNAALSYGMGSTSTELLSNQLSNWLSQISNDFDIGVNYRPGDEISSQEVELALSTQLFNDRVVIDGNFGVAGNNPARTTQRTSNIIGDVNVEVKITPEGKFRVKAFNRSNTFDLLNTNAPYTQGVGVFYRREFDSLGELLRRKKKTAEEVQKVEEPLNAAEQ